MPAEGVERVGEGGDPQRLGAVVDTRFQGSNGAAVLVVAEAPQQGNEDQGGDGPAASARPALARADLLVDQPEQRGHHQAGDQGQGHERLDDEDDVPGVPGVVEGREGADTVVVGEVEEDVQHAAQTGIQEEQPPAGGERGRLAAQPVEGVDDAQGEGRIQREPEQGVGEAAMVGEAGHRAEEVHHHVDVRHLAGDGHDGGGVGGGAVQPGAADAGAGKNVGDRFQVPLP